MILIVEVDSTLYMTTIVLILEGGDIVVVREETQPGEDAVEIVGSVDDGIAAAAWTPDEELVLLATKSDLLLLMTRRGLEQETRRRSWHLLLLPFLPQLPRARHTLRSTSPRQQQALLSLQFRPPWLARALTFPSRILLQHLTKHLQRLSLHQQPCL